MIDGDRFDVAITESARIAALFVGKHDPLVIEGLSYYVLASDTPEIHPLDVMATGAPFVVNELYHGKKAAVVTGELFADEDLCREIIAAKQTI